MAEDEENKVLTSLANAKNHPPSDSSGGSSASFGAPRVESEDKAGRIADVKNADAAQPPSAAREKDEEFRTLKQQKIAVEERNKVLGNLLELDESEYKEMEYKMDPFLKDLHMGFLPGYLNPEPIAGTAACVLAAMICAIFGFVPGVIFFGWISLDVGASKTSFAGKASDDYKKSDLPPYRIIRADEKTFYPSYAKQLITFMREGREKFSRIKNFSAYKGKMNDFQAAKALWENMMAVTGENRKVVLSKCKDMVINFNKRLSADLTGVYRAIQAAPPAQKNQLVQQFQNWIKDFAEITDKGVIAKGSREDYIRISSELLAMTDSAFAGIEGVGEENSKKIVSNMRLGVERILDQNRILRMIHFANVGLENVFFKTAEKYLLQLEKANGTIDCYNQEIDTYHTVNHKNKLILNKENRNEMNQLELRLENFRRQIVGESELLKQLEEKCNNAIGNVLIVDQINELLGKIDILVKDAEEREKAEKTSFQNAFALSEKRKIFSCPAGPFPTGGFFEGLFEMFKKE